MQTEDTNNCDVYPLWLPALPSFANYFAVQYHSEMPRQSRTISDDILLARLGDRQTLSDELWLIAPQVGMLIGRSTSQLNDDRKVGNPPPAMYPFGEKGGVRYRLGTIRDLMFNTKEFANTRQARVELERSTTAGLRFASFHDWIDGAKPNDEWPFLIPEDGPPVDFWKSLEMGDRLSDNDQCEMLRLKDYLELRSQSAQEIHSIRTTTVGNVLDARQALRTKLREARRAVAESSWSKSEDGIAQEAAELEELSIRAYVALTTKLRFRQQSS